MISTQASTDKMTKKALFPGTFDPFTVGHANIVERALPLFEKIVIAVGINDSKRPLYPTEKRVQFIRSLYENDSRIEVMSYDDLTLDLAHRINANFILRGIRSVKDFEYERDVAAMNKRLGGVETILMLTEPQYASISSSVVRELIRYGRDVSEFLPKP